MRILLVDDDENNLDIQSRIIKKLGYEVDSVSTGEDGVQRALVGGYGLIFLDYILPGISGAEAVVAIRNKEKSGFRIPIIALTGISEDFEYADYGFDDIMTKPISIDDFRTIFKKWLPNS
jgi:CheY-like chemotaxis protein